VDAATPSGAHRRPRRPRRTRQARHPQAKRFGSRARLSWRTRAILLAILLGLGLFLWGYLARRFAPLGNTSRTHFDAIVVLGNPADSDGNPTPTQLARVTEAVHEYERGVAGHLIFTGGAVENRFAEADVMARTAQAQGIPASAIATESHARNTIENACYSVRIMKERGWSSAEVVSSASHIERAGLIFSQMPIQWRVHAAPPVEPEPALVAEEQGLLETLKTVRYLVWARQIDQCEP